MALPLRDYTFIGTTQSLCPTCLKLLPAKIIVRNQRVYFRKSCGACGEREDFVCSDVAYFDKLEHSVPAKLPRQVGVEPKKGCPYDCGLCTEHEQHTCVGLVEVTSSCNLTCPMCFASSSPKGKHLSLDDCKKAIDRLVETEGQPELMQLSGGEPTLHPQFLEILDYAVSQPIDFVQINTNGVRFGHDPKLIETVSRHRERVEIFFQLDGLRPEVTQKLRGEDLLPLKLKAIEALGKANLNVTLGVTLQGGVNDDQLGPLIQFAKERPWIGGINFQPATYSGRHELPETLENRMTFPDVIKGISRQTEGMFTEDDFRPLPCAHPNCHSLAYAFRFGGDFLPINRLINIDEHMDLLANGICLTREKAKQLVSTYLNRLTSSCGSGCGCDTGLMELEASFREKPELMKAAEEFFAGVMGEKVGAQQAFRITITSFLDAYNFDVRRLMKCCTHHVLPSGHIIPFCAYNVLYREGHVPLPELTAALSLSESPATI